MGCSNPNLAFPLESYSLAIETHISNEYSSINFIILDNE